MRTVGTVFCKEVLDNIRDRRTLLSALLMGPLFGPVLFAFVINLSIDRAISSAEKTLEVPVVGAEFAPNLQRYLESRNMTVVEGLESYETAVESVKLGTHDLVLVIPAEFGEQLRNSLPARIELVSNAADTAAARDANRVRSALQSYSHELASYRLMARGVSPIVVRPISIDEIDVSTSSGRSAILLGMMSYFFIFAMLMGGMYLAIDTTAGERERGSLEPLLALPATRGRLMFGKILAACLFMILALFLSMVSFYFALRFMPLDKLGLTPNFGPQAVLLAFLMFLPFVLLGASLMTLVASFTKSYKEAQTWLGFLMLLPTLPILVASLLNLRPRTELMFVPSLSQHLLLIDLVKNEPINLLYVLISVLSTLSLGALLAWLCARLYRREGLLG
ncbi:MAG TPA: ABC transporter permease [Woeseiaceae bacterium]|nr:ABC transporter permease [Woeseiaceae bacterium]